MNLNEFVIFTEDVNKIEEIKPDLLTESQSISALDYLCKAHKILFD